MRALGAEQDLQGTRACEGGSGQRHSLLAASRETFPEHTRWEGQERSFPPPALHLILQQISSAEGVQHTPGEVTGPHLAAAFTDRPGPKLSSEPRRQEATTATCKLCSSPKHILPGSGSPWNSSEGNATIFKAVLPTPPRSLSEHSHTLFWLGSEKGSNSPLS